MGGTRTLVAMETSVRRASDVVCAVVGPTASGKSDLALELACVLPEALGAQSTGEIVSADALQLSRGMDVGTAKTPVEERRGIAHHQIDVLEVRDEASVAAYQKHARADVAGIHARGGVAVVAGGSGLYQRALLDVIEFPGTDPAVRARLEEEAEGPMGARGLHDRLTQLDPLSAERIDPHNARRIIRALEVIELTGTPFQASQPPKDAPPRWGTRIVGLRTNAEWLNPRIELRTRMMFEQGLIDETRALVTEGLVRNSTAGRAIGYAQVLAMFDGELTEEEALEQTITGTRRYVRRQRSWFNRDPRTVWLDAADSNVVDLALDSLA